MVAVTICYYYYYRYALSIRLDFERFGKCIFQNDALPMVPIVAIF